MIIEESKRSTGKNLSKKRKKIFLNKGNKDRESDEDREDGRGDKSVERAGAEFRSIANYAVAGKPPRLVHGSELG